MIFILNGFFFIIEIVALILLGIRIAKFHQLSLKDTFVYPIIILIGTIVISYLEKDPNVPTWENIVSGLSNSLNIVKLSPKTDYIKNFESYDLEKQFFIVNYYVLYFLSATGLLGLSISLLKATVKNLGSRFIKSFFSEKTIVFGLNDDAKKFIKGLENNKRKNVLFILDSSVLHKYVEERLFLEKYKISYKMLPYSNMNEIKQSLYKVIFHKNNIFLRLMKWICKLDYKMNIITFFDSDSLNINFISASRQLLQEEDCYGGYTYERINDNKVYDGQIYLVKLLNSDKKNIKIGEDKVLAHKKNSFVLKCNSMSEGEMIALDDALSDKSLYTIDLNEFGKKNLKKYKIIFSNEKFELYAIDYKRPRSIFFNISCNGVQQELLEKIISDHIQNDCDMAIDGSLNLYPDSLNNRFITDYSRGMIRTFNKYDITSFDFIRNHSFARYIDKENISDNSTLENCDINLYVLGYGAVNQPLLRDIIVFNQFAERVYDEDNKNYSLKMKRIHIDVYDKQKEITDDSFSVGFLKYDKNTYNKDKYFDLPDNYLEEKDFHLGCPVNNYQFVKKIYDKVKESSMKKEKQYNFFLISLDSDSMNWEVASILEENCTKDNSKNVFFVRTKSFNYLYGNIEYFKERNMIGFGVEEYDANFKNKEISYNPVFSYQNLTGGFIRENAMRLHFLYEEKALGTKIEESIIDYSFSLLPRIKQLSNIYSIFGLYSKLSLMKLDEKEYKENFNKKIKVVKPENGNYSLKSWITEKKEFTSSEVMAFLEKERWNAFEIAYGFLPMKKENIKLENGKLKKESGQYHGCICSHKGIIDFEKATGNDYVQYDYDIMNYLHEHNDLLDKYIEYITNK